MHARFKIFLEWTGRRLSIPPPLRPFIPLGGSSPLSQPMRLLALALAVNYFFFHAELSEEEYLRNNPPPSTDPTFIASPFTWETFGKTDVTSALSAVPIACIHELFQLPVPPLATSFVGAPPRRHLGRAPPVM